MITPGDNVRLRHFFGPAGRCAVSLLNEAAQMRFDGTMPTKVGVSKDEERVPKDIDEAMNEYEASYRIEGSKRTAGANGMHTENTSQPLSGHDTGIQSDDVEMNENVARMWLWQNVDPKLKPKALMRSNAPSICLWRLQKSHMPRKTVILDPP